MYYYGTTVRFGASQYTFIIIYMYVIIVVK